MDIIIIAGVYLLTGVTAIILYASRLYSNRSAIRDIPKTYLPIEKADLPGYHVNSLIQERLARSAVTAYIAKPRSHRIEKESAEIRERIAELTKVDSRRLTEDPPSWGYFGHAGWTAPATTDLPGSLHFENVVKELPDLLEAKAVSLVPTDATALRDIDETAIPDEAIIEALQRPSDLGIRDYLERLVALGMIEQHEIVQKFVSAFERARYGPIPILEADFRHLMNCFAELLRAMLPIDSQLLGQFLDEAADDAPSDSDVLLGDEQSSILSGNGSVQRKASRKQGSAQKQRPGPLLDKRSTTLHGHDSDADDESLHTALVKQTARSLSRPSMSSRMLSARSFQSVSQSQSRSRPRRLPHHNMNTNDEGDSRHMDADRSLMSRTSSRSLASAESGGSVIRLANSESPRDLPFEYVTSRP